MELREGISLLAICISSVALWYSKRAFSLNYNPSIWVTGDSTSGLTIHNLGNRGIIVTETIEHFSFTNVDRPDIVEHNLKHKGMIESGKSWILPAGSAAPFMSPTALYEIKYRYGSDTRHVHTWQVATYIGVGKIPTILQQGKSINPLKIINFKWLQQKLTENGFEEREIEDALFFSGKRN